MTDERDYYSTHRAPGRGESSSSGMRWGGLALIALVLLMAVFFLFGSNPPENGTEAPDLAPPAAETTEPAPVEPEPVAPIE